MRHHDARSPLKRHHRAGDLVGRLLVQGRRGLVEEQHPRPMQQAPRDAHTLPLATREVRPSLAARVVHTVRRHPRPDDIMVYAFLGKQRLDQVLMALAPASSNFFQVLIDNLGQEQQDTTEITKAGEVDPAMLQDIFSLMVVAYAERREERELVIDGLASAAIALASPAIRRPPGRRRPDDLVALLLTEIAAHPESVTLQGLAERFSYNPTYLSGLLHAQCVRTFSQLVREQRMLRAHQLLTDTGLPVAKVAAMVGYEGTSNFHRLFREHFGETPAQVRAGRSARAAAMMETRAHNDHSQEVHDDRA
ncbi:AraC family transcriptional regulator [Olsenella sp. AM05-7]|nr:AraC family transcriptional regulator [Olsenella sp. AM05-7]